MKILVLFVLMLSGSAALAKTTHKDQELAGKKPVGHAKIPDETAHAAIDVLKCETGGCYGSIRNKPLGDTPRDEIIEEGNNLFVSMKIKAGQPDTQAVPEKKKNK
jgi:hypothetical protein